MTARFNPLLPCARSNCTLVLLGPTGPELHDLRSIGAAASLAAVALEAAASDNPEGPTWSRAEVWGRCPKWVRVITVTP